MSAAPPPAGGTSGAAAPPAPGAVRALAEQHIPYVRAIASKVKRSVAQEIELEDLVEYGMVGLMEAAARFRPELGAHFTTFAYYRIRGAIYDGLRGMGWMSRTAYAKARFEERANGLMAELAAEGALEARGAAAIGPGAVGGGANSPQHRAVGALAKVVTGLAAVYITSLDAAENIPAGGPDGLPVDEALGLAQARHIVRDTLKKLSAQERQLLDMYYYQDKSLQEVGDAMGLSKSWTSRLHARVIIKLQRLLEPRLA